MSAAAMYSKIGIVPAEPITTDKQSRKRAKKSSTQPSKKKKSVPKKVKSQIDKENSSTNKPILAPAADSKPDKPTTNVEKPLSEKNAASKPCNEGSINQPAPPIKAPSEGSTVAPIVAPSASSTTAAVLNTLNSDDCLKEADQLFRWLIGPISPKVFFRDHWEKEHLLIQRKDKNYNSGWFSTDKLKEILQNVS